jgi:dTDP-4-amino-4,6-dideoxygalactose transaminase
VIACASGTDALLMAMMAKAVGPGDAVLCPAFTYTATPETIALLGATPVFVDVRQDTFNLDPAALKAGLDAARRKGLRPVGVIAVDLFGLPADYPALRTIADAFGLWLLADAAQSCGATLGTRAVGTLGDITATSFFPSKPLGCYGDGGALFTADPAIADVLDSIRLHGKGKGADKYDIVRIGINGRLDTLQAAILLEKLALFSEEIAQRQRVAARYHAGLAASVTVPTVPAGTTSVWAQYTLRVPAARRAAIIETLRRDGVPAAVYYPRPLHHQAAYRHFPTPEGGLPRAEQLAREVLSLPICAYLEPADQDYVIDRVRRALADA